MLDRLDDLKKMSQEYNISLNESINTDDEEA